MPKTKVVLPEIKKKQIELEKLKAKAKILRKEIKEALKQKQKPKNNLTENSECCILRFD